MIACVLAGVEILLNFHHSVIMGKEECFWCVTKISVTLVWLILPLSELYFLLHFSLNGLPGWQQLIAEKAWTSSAVHIVALNVFSVGFNVKSLTWPFLRLLTAITHGHKRLFSVVAQPQAILPGNFGLWRMRFKRCHYRSQ